MRLIDANALIEKHCEGCNKDIRDGCKTDPVCATLMWFEDAPTIDAVPVVRCKDCKHRDPENHHCDHAGGTSIYFPRKPDDYCSYGERKGGDGR